MPVATAAACVLLVAGPAEPAAAHATLVATDPVEGAVLTAAPATATFTFDEPVSLPGHAVQVFDARGRAVDATAVARDEVVSVDLPETTMTDGTYVVAWRIVSADGHPVAGSLSFSVGAPSPTVRAPVAQRAADRAVTGALSVLRAVGFLGLLLAAGLSAFSALLLPPALALDRSRARLRRAARLGAMAAVAAGVLALPVTTAYQQGGGLSTVADPATWSAVGGAEVLGLVTLVAGLALVLVPRRGTRPAAVARVPLLAGITLVVLSPALTGHSRAFDPQLPVIVTDALHVLAGSIWLGGLVGLAMTLPALGGRGQAAAEVLTRFSTAAAAVLVALIAAGCLLAWRILGSWESLLGTTYGRLLLAKIAVVAVAVALAAGNRYLLLPRLRAAVGHADRQSGAAKMSQAVTVEAVVVVAAIAVTGFLVNQSPGAATPTVRDGRSGVQTAQLGELRVLAIMTPRAPGTNTVLVQLQDATGEPVEPTRLPEVRVGSDTVNLGKMPVTSCDTGTYCAEVMLPTAGRWVVQVSLRVSEFENPVAAVTFRVPPG